MAPPPFFIVGSARSGTTLLRLMLNAHPDIAVPPESRFITELRTEGEIDVDGFAQRLAAHSRFQTWDLPIQAVMDELSGVQRARYADAIDATFRAYARVHGKKRWGDKTPRYIEDIPFLASLFAGARFVHLVRDGRNVALSYADVPFGPKTVARAAALWMRRVEAGVRDGRALPDGRYCEFRYEDLVEDPEGEIKSLCDFLDVSFHPDMLDYTERARGAVLSRASAYNPYVKEKPLQNVRSWEEDMPPSQVEVFEAIAGRALTILGYARRYPTPRPAARVAARLGLMGLPLGRIRGRRGRGV